MHGWHEIDSDKVDSFEILRLAQDFDQTQVIHVAWMQPIHIRR